MDEVVTTGRFALVRAMAEALDCPPEIKRLVLATLDLAEPHDRWTREEARAVHAEYDAAVLAVADLERDKAAQ